MTFFTVTIKGSKYLVSTRLVALDNKTLLIDALQNSNLVIRDISHWEPSTSFDVEHLELYLNQKERFQWHIY